MAEISPTTVTDKAAGKAEQTEDTSQLSLTQLYSRADRADARRLLSNPTELKTLYEENAKYMDPSGTGYISKTNITDVLKDRTALPETKRLASTLLLGYETINKLDQGGNPVAHVIPGLEFLSRTDTTPGVSENKIARLLQGLDDHEAGAARMSSALRTGLTIAGVTGAFLLCKNLPRDVVTSVGRVLVGSPAAVDNKLINAAFGRTTMSYAKEFATSTTQQIPKIGIAGGASFGGSYLFGMYDQHRERKFINDFVTQLEPVRKPE